MIQNQLHNWHWPGPIKKKLVWPPTPLLEYDRSLEVHCSMSSSHHHWSWTLSNTRKAHTHTQKPRSLLLSKQQQRGKKIETKHWKQSSPFAICFHLIISLNETENDSRQLWKNYHHHRHQESNIEHRAAEGKVDQSDCQTRGQLSTTIEWFACPTPGSPGHVKPSETDQRRRRRKFPLAKTKWPEAKQSTHSLARSLAVRR